MQVRSTVKGGAFLIDQARPEEIFTPEQLTPDERLMGQTAGDFALRSVRPRAEEMERDHAVAAEVLREAGDLGLLGLEAPEAHGGMGLSQTASAFILESLAKGSASFSVTFGAHTGIGTLPIVLFGAEEQKARYLPALASGQKIAAYALTEPDAGSDALGVKTEARLSPDGRHYVLNGQKQWITNAGFADVFVLYAKVDGDKMTAFIVERESAGLKVGPEFDKMGLEGSSTCSLYLDGVAVPVRNVLGEVGKGHTVAFNVLNAGRLKLAYGCLGSCKALLEISAQYAGQRRQFGKPIAAFPAVQQKLAMMAARTFAVESAAYRTAGLLDEEVRRLQQNGEASAKYLAAREYAVEASINKVLSSEALDYVVDEAVQIHGGYGYMRESQVERAYRDSRINRIFEGTNEINRLLMPGMLLSRATRGELPLFQAVQRVQAEVTSAAATPDGQGAGGPLQADVEALANLKRAALLLAGIGAMKYMTAIEGEQELLLALADLAVLSFAWESALLRAQRLEREVGPEASAIAMDMALLFGDWAAEQGEMTARRAAASLEEGDNLRTQLALLRRLFRRQPLDVKTVGRRLGQAVVASSGYPLAKQR